MSRPRQFIVWGVAIALVVLAGGWLTGLRHVMHAALLSVATVAFLPFVAVAGLLALGIVASALSHGGQGAEGFGEGAVAAAASIPRYYRWLSSRRHPLFWGVIAGTMLGGLLLWGWIGVAVLPGEDRTVHALSEARREVEAVYERTSSYPEPVDGHLLHDGQPLLDGFGRPLRYERSGEWKLASYQLSSLGYDGAPGGDDLCISGSTQLLGLAKLVTELAPGKAPGALSDRLGAIRELRCH